MQYMGAGEQAIVRPPTQADTYSKQTGVHSDIIETALLIVKNAKSNSASDIAASYNNMLSLHPGERQELLAAYDFIFKYPNISGVSGTPSTPGTSGTSGASGEIGKIALYGGLAIGALLLLKGRM